MPFRDIRDFEEYKEREEELSSSRSIFMPEREVAFSSLPPPAEVSRDVQLPPPAPPERGEVARAPEGGSKPQNLDRRTLAGKLATPSTVFGTEAWTAVGDNRAQRFTTPAIASPCVARSMRRQVMFAKGKAGIGYRKRKRLNLYSNVEC